MGIEKFNQKKKKNLDIHLNELYEFDKQKLDDSH